MQFVLECSSDSWSQWWRARAGRRERTGPISGLGQCPAKTPCSRDPFFFLALYDHLNKEMRDGELVRLDVGCEWQHYQGDLGRTVPVSGHYSDDQGETWNIFV